MNSRNKVIITVLVILMFIIAFSFGKGAESMNPDGLLLSAPSEDGSTEKISAFGFGAAIGLLLVSLFYCLLAAGLLLSSSLKKKPPGPLPLIVAIIAAVGFSLSYVVDGYFL